MFYERESHKKWSGYKNTLLLWKIYWVKMVPSHSKTAAFVYSVILVTFLSKDFLCFTHVSPAESLQLWDPAIYSILGHTSAELLIKFWWINFLVVCKLERSDPLLHTRLETRFFF